MTGNMPAWGDISADRIMAATTEMDFAPVSLGKYLTLIRIARGVSAKEFSDLLGVRCPGGVYRMENEIIQPPMEKLVQIAHAMGYPVRAFDPIGYWMSYRGVCRILPGLRSNGNKGPVEPGMYLKLARFRRGVSQAYLEQAAGVAHGIIVSYENGNYAAMDFYRRRNIADILCYPVGLLFSSPEEMARRKEYIL